MSSLALTLTGLSHAQIDLAPDATTRRALALQSAATITSVTDAFDADCAASALREVTLLAGEIETARVEIKAPVLALGKKIDAIAKDFSAQLEAEKTRIGRILGDYQAAERVKADRARREALAEAERKAREAALASAAAEVATDPAEATRAQQLSTRREAEAQAAALQAAESRPVVPEGTTTRRAWKYEVTDLAALYKARSDLCVIEPNAAAIRAQIPHNQNIPGLRIWQEAKTTVR